MIKILLILLISCTYSDPHQARINRYQCEDNVELVIRVAEDLASIVLQHGDEEALLLRRFVTTEDDGYRTDEYLWKTEGSKARLLKFDQDGKEEELLSECKLI